MTEDRDGDMTGMKIKCILWTMIKSKGKSGKHVRAGIRAVHQEAQCALRGHYRTKLNLFFANIPHYIYSDQP